MSGGGHTEACLSANRFGAFECRCECNRRRELSPGAFEIGLTEPDLVRWFGHGRVYRAVAVDVENGRVVLDPVPDPIPSGEPICPQCGPRVKAADDGTCAHCGATLVDRGVIVDLLAIRENAELRRACDEAEFEAARWIDWARVMLFGDRTPLAHRVARLSVAMLLERGEEWLPQFESETRDDESDDESEGER